MNIKRGFYGLILLGVFSIFGSPTYGQWNKYVIDNDLHTAVSVDTADLDGDNKLDLIITEAFGNNLIWYQNDFPVWNKHVIDSRAYTVTFAFCEDMDGDDTTDVVAVHYGTSKLVWYENNLPDWTMHTIDATTDNADFMQVADINGDGKPDVVTAGGENGGDVVWYENTHSEIWTRHIIESGNSNTSVIRIADIDNDMQPDIVAAMPEKNDVVWYKTVDKGLTWQKSIIDDNLYHAFSSNVGDVNGDGMKDVVATTGGPYYSGKGVVWYENHHPEWIKHEIDEDLPGATQSYVTDINGDGLMDIFANGFSSDDVVWYENKTSGWNKHFIDDDLDGPRTGLIWDVDGDNVDDLVLPATSELVWYKNPNTEIAYVDEIELSKSFISISQNDPLVINASSINSELHSLNIFAEIKGIQSQYTDTLQLFDDSLNEDGASSDNNWGIVISAEALPEDIFEVKAFTHDLNNDTKIVFPKLTRFTTIGPLMVENSVELSDSIVYKTDTILYLSLSLKNNSLTAVASNVSAKLQCFESYVATPSTFIKYPDIAPGESSVSIQSYRVAVSRTCPKGPSSLVLEIAVDDYVFWTDTIPILITNIEKSNNQLCKIYPNPTYDFISIELTDPVQTSIEIVSLNGKLIYSTTMQETSKQIDLSQYRKGLYFIRLRSMDFTRTEKLIRL